MRFFTSDTHFRHSNIIEYDKRPFKNLKEMEDVIVKNWNNTVSKNDVVYHLGDFSFGNASTWSPIVRRLKGKIRLIRGNHDLQNKATCGRTYDSFGPIFDDICDIKCIDVGSFKVVLSHYPYHLGIETDDCRRPELRPNNVGLWLVHGHSHALQPMLMEKMINVGCMLWDWKPVSEVKILKIINENDKKYEIPTK